MLFNKRSRILHSPKQLQKKRKKIIITTVLIFSCIIFILIFAILFFRLSFFQIKTINVIGAKNLNQKELEEKALSVLNGNLLYFLPRTSRFFYSKDNINKALTEEYKDIDAMNIKSSGLSAININIVERLPNALVCSGFQEEDENDSCFYSDNNGYIYSQAPKISEGVYSIYFLNSDSDSFKIGSNFIDPAKFKELQKFYQDVNTSGIKPSGILINNDDSYELYVKNKDSSNAVVYFDNRIPFEKTSSNLIVFWQNAMNKKLGTSTIPIFDYINLRFGNNIFYLTK